MKKLFKLIAVFNKDDNTALQEGLAKDASSRGKVLSISNISGTPEANIFLKSQTKLDTGLFTVYKSVVEVSE